MSGKRKILLGTGLLIVSTIALVVGYFLYVIYKLPEAYAAWDTGAALVQYLQQNDNRWPTSWDKLRTAMEEREGFQNRFGGDAQYRDGVFRQMKEYVLIDWTFDPRQPMTRPPVTPVHASRFRITFSGAEPNEMVRNYLSKPAATRPAIIDSIP